jgi:hypothetical protein
VTPTRDRAQIFEAIEHVLLRYASPFTVRRETPADKPDVHLWSGGDVEIAGRKRAEVYFAGAIVQQGYVGSYFQPVYSDPAREDLVPPELRALLKGKSCFHVGELDDERLGQIEHALEQGFGLYRERGWI